MLATMSQDNFLSNYKNKQRLINLLCVNFEKEGFVVKQAEEDANYLIIKSVLEIEKRSQRVVVVGEDIDLLVIMAASINSENIFFLSLGEIHSILDLNPLTPSDPQNLTTFVYGGFVDIWIREMDSSAFSPLLLTVGGRKPTGA
ncbi:hypothetical protein AVEN_262301-1 [Araneus ventricosus]|uniref:Uncharacterized protein n=1 Tax=Araneus ventricosus TaxID=182803 RepID=A0A4Y2RB32_ARAVE|nr:hypothetical protein AVEN_262301-1 [Araneus ventricosus]